MAGAQDLEQGPRPAASAAEGSPAKPLTKLQRSVEVARILYRHNVLGMLREIAIAERRVVGIGEVEIAIPPELPRRVRRLLEELGPTFVKIGQLLGTRPDLVPKEFVDEFRNLYDKTTPTPFPQVKALLERELGRPLEEMFVEFEERAVASASIGQVHFAVLKTGEPVAVKVQHPDVEERVFTDFALVEPIVTFIEKLFAASRIWQPREHLLEVYAMLVKELDYRYEARNHQRVYANLKDTPGVKIPRIHWDYSAKRVLVLERIEGVKLSDFDNPDFRALDGKKLAQTITHAMAKQIFEDRLFHADPSPGNLMAVGSDTVAFLDFGAVGKVTRRRAERMLALVGGFVRNDVDVVVEALLDIARVTGDVDRSALTKEVERIMDYHERERASVADPVVMDMLVQIGRRHNILIPSDYLLISRALFQFEGLCKKLDPEYELVEVLEPYVREHIRREMLGVGKEKEVLFEAAWQAADFLRTFPGRMNNLLKKIESNDLAVEVRLAGGAEQAAREERRNYRTAFTILVGAILLGAALVLGPGAGQLLTFFVVATLFVLLWAFAMLYFSET